MAEAAAAARREARRRRILENSENRLRKITGVSENGACESVEEQHEYCNGPVLNRWEEEKSLSPNCHADHTSAVANEDCFEAFEHLSAIGSRMKIVDQDTDSNEKLKDVEVGLLSLLSLMKVHFICLALFVRILYFFNYGFLFGETLLVPFCIMELTSLTLLGAVYPRPSFLQTVLLLSGVSVHIVEVFTKYTNIITAIVKDFAVYFMTFMLFHISLLCVT